MRLGVLPEEYRVTIANIRAALLENLTPDGMLGGVSQSNKGGEALQRSGYRVISQMSMGLLANIIG